jgi:hypothetical protein
MLEEQDPSLFKLGYCIPPSQRILKAKKKGLSLKDCCEKNGSSEVIPAWLLRGSVGKQ